MRTIYEENTPSPARQEHGERGAGAAGSDDDDVMRGQTVLQRGWRDRSNQYGRAALDAASSSLVSREKCPNKTPGKAGGRRIDPMGEG